MTSISLSKYAIGLLIALLLGWQGVGEVSAQARGSGVSITVSPTLIELGTQPGEIWRSSVKVVNTNTFPLTVYVEPAHFAPAGEQGQGSIIPYSAVPEDEPVLANWITVPESVITIEAGKSKAVPFIVETPDSAAPGSHFAALQVSTVPPSSDAAVGLNTAQVISSLLFLRVAGDIEESATIRSFTATNAFQSVAKSNMQIRFANTGNSHVQPVGEIVITNMWGSERGRIPVNVNTSFGNALPDTIRAYDFAWERQPGLLDVGYHTAAVTLAYGSEEKQFVSSKTRFWVIPIKPILFTVLAVVAVVGLVMFVSRWYIRRLLAQAGVSSLQSLQSSKTQPVAIHSQHDLDLGAANTPTAKNTTLLAALLRWWRRGQQGVRTLGQQGYSVWRLIPIRVRWGIVGTLILTVALLSVLVGVFRGAPGYQATIGTDGQAVTYNAEEIAFFQQPGMSPERLQPDASYQVVLRNASRTPGLAGSYAANLVDRFPVTALETATERRGRSVIIFPTALQAEAVALSKALPGALLSATDQATTTIVVYVAE